MTTTQEACRHQWVWHRKNAYGEPRKRCSLCWDVIRCDVELPKPDSLPKQNKPVRRETKQPAGAQTNCDHHWVRGGRSCGHPLKMCSLCRITRNGSDLPYQRPVWGLKEHTQRGDTSGFSQGGFCGAYGRESR